MKFREVGDLVTEEEVMGFVFGVEQKENVQNHMRGREIFIFLVL